MAAASARDTAKGTANRFLDFVNNSLSPFHAVKYSKDVLTKSGFKELKDGESWKGKVEKGGKYFFTRNNTTLFAFRIGGAFDAEKTGFKIIGAHTDSPCPRISPNSKLTRETCIQLNTQLYGGGLWLTWFDRDLTLAGRVLVKNGERIESRLFRCHKALLRIPSLAIHLQSADERANPKINSEKHMKPVFASAIENAFANPDEEKKAADLPLASRHPYALLQLIAKDLEVDESQIVDFDLCLADSQPSQLIGVFDEYISSPRLDNLLSSFTALEAITSEKVNTDNDPMISMIAMYDHEEIGSVSAQGASSSITVNTMERLFKILSPGESDLLNAAYARSYIVSADMAHAVHPNYTDKHQEIHKPHMHDGIVIKVNANQRYTTDAISEAILCQIAEKSDVPLQRFIVKNDAGCGSTIGPTLASRTGCKTIDVGAAQLSMHSCREMCGYRAPQYYLSLWEGFFNLYHTLDLSLLDA